MIRVRWLNWITRSARGAVGATSNPLIVLNVLNQEMHLWRDRIRQIIVENPTWSETQVAWQVYEEVAVNGGRMMLPTFERESGPRGRLSIQTDPANYRNAAAILAQAEHFHSLLPNLHIKIPATQAGMAMIEEATYRGISINVDRQLHRAAGGRRRGGCRARFAAA